MKNKINLIFALILFIGIDSLFVFLFFNCLNEYKKYDISYEELVYEKLTFDRYERIIKSKGGDTFEIYFEEYDVPFEIDNITQKELNKKELKDLKDGEKLDVYYRENDSKKYEYEICEMKSQDVTYLEFSNYISVNRNNEILGMIISPILVIISTFLCGFFIYLFISIR